MIRGLRQELIMVNKLMCTLVWIILADWVILKGGAAAGERAERGGEKIKIALEYGNVEDAGQTPGSDTLKGLNNFVLIDFCRRIRVFLSKKIFRKFILSDFFQVRVSFSITLILMPLIVTLKAWVHYNLSVARA